MSKVLENMKTRRSIRKYNDDPVPQEILDQIMEAGLYAASAHGTQDSIILQVTDKKLRDELAEKEPDYWRLGRGIRSFLRSAGSIGCSWKENEFESCL